jgi:aminoglycoside phosphotransferase (APT) family kinase protein
MTTDDLRQTIIAGLADLGIDASAPQTVPRWREWRWVMPIDAERICYFAHSPSACMRLQRERLLLRKLQGRLCCEIPSVVAVSEDEQLQLRRMVLGDQIQNREYEIGTSKGWERIAESYGAAIASLHLAIDPRQAAALVQPRPENLPYPAEELRSLADRWLRDVGLARQVNAILDHYAAIRVVPKHHALIHGDLIADNIVFDLSVRRFIGMFDFSDAEVADRHLDLKYIHSFGRRFADRLMAAYEGKAGILLDRRRPAIYHVAAAVSHLRTVGDQGDPPPRQNRVEEWIELIIDDAF